MQTLQTARVVLPLRPPHLAYQLLLPHDRAELARQALQHPVFERRQVQLAVRPAALAPRQVDAAPSELQQPLRARAAHLAAQRRAQPRQQLRRAEGLGDVVVGAGIERRDLLLPPSCAPTAP